MPRDHACAAGWTLRRICDVLQLDGLLLDRLAEPLHLCTSRFQLGDGLVAGPARPRRRQRGHRPVLGLHPYPGDRGAVHTPTVGGLVLLHLPGDQRQPHLVLLRSGQLAHDPPL